MRSIDSSILAKLKAGELAPFDLLTIEIDSTTFRYTDCDVPILYSSNIWAPRGFSHDAINYSMENIIDQMNLSIDDLDDALTSYFTGGTPQGSDVILQETVLDDNDSPLGVVTKFMGTIDSWDFDGEKIDITVESVLSRWNQRTLSLHSPSCRIKKFKDSICGYPGSATWCDRTYARCAALANTANFRGYRWLSSIEDKEIWWGRTREI